MKNERCACKGYYLDKFIQPAILTVLYETPSHGFSIIKELKNGGIVTGNALDPTGLYRTLKKMEATGLLSSGWDTEGAAQPRRIYSITPDGKECLQVWKDTLIEYQRGLCELTTNIENVLKL